MSYPLLKNFKALVNDYKGLLQEMEDSEAMVTLKLNRKINDSYEQLVEIVQEIEEAENATWEAE